MGLVVRLYSRTTADLFGILTRNARSATSLAQSSGAAATKEKAGLKKDEEEIKIDLHTIAKLERISLVDFGNEGGIQRLEAAIRFARKLKEVPLDPSVKPMYTVLEDQKLELREDKISEETSREEILKNAKVTEDEYFVAPPGNIPKSS